MIARIAFLLTLIATILAVSHGAWKSRDNPEPKHAGPAKTRMAQMERSGE
jgi:hypothetical protein